jgi:hypothetical protein
MRSMLKLRVIASLFWLSSFRLKRRTPRPSRKYRLWFNRRGQSQANSGEKRTDLKIGDYEGNRKRPAAAK